MATTSAIVSYGSYRFNPVPQIGFRSSANPLGANKSGPADRERVVTLVGKIIGIGFTDIQSRVWAMEAAFSKQDQTLIWNDGTTERINHSAKVLSIDIPAEWGTYEANFTITLTYLPLDDTNTPPFAVSYGGYTFNPIPVFGRDLKGQRESPDSIVRLANRWTLSLSGFIDKGSLSANQTEYDALRAAVNVDDTFVYGGFTQAVKMEDARVELDSWQSKINYSLTMIYTDNLLSGGIINMSSQRSIQRYNQRNAKHLIPFLDFGQVQLLGESPQSITATGFIVADTMAHARTAANTEINNQFPAAAPNGIRVEEDSSRVVEKSSENRVEWNVTVYYTIPPLQGGVYGSG